MASFTKADVKAIIDMKGLDNLSAKSVRISLEERLGLEEGALKPAKATISEMIDAVLNDMPQEDGDDEEEEEEEEEKPAKKAKKETKAAASDDNPNKGKSTCTIRGGEEVPKNLKAMQEKVKGMSVSKFLDSGKALEIDVDGNILRGEPRSFSSGNLGWYLNGKVPIDVGGVTVWAQVGMNVTIPGSQSWKK